MYVEVAGRKYYQLNFIDEYSRFIDHHELLGNMEVSWFIVNWNFPRDPLVG